MFIAIGKVAILVGVSKTTLRRWDKTRILRSTFRTVGEHRRYHYATIQEFIKGKNFESE